MSDVTVEDLVKKINNILSLEIKSDDYDLGVILPKMAKTNCNSIENAKTHQDHIAVTGSKRYFFPVLDNYRLSEYSTYFKSLYTFCVDINFYKKNIEYMYRNYINNDDGVFYKPLSENFLDCFDTDILQSKASIKPSHRSDNSDQIELGIREKVSNDNLMRFRSLIQQGDYIVFLKKRGSIVYDFFTFKNKDWDITCNDIIISDTSKNVNRFEVDVSPSNVDNKNTNHKGTNTIYVGAPGTGKSYKVDEIIKNTYNNLSDTNDFVFRTTIYKTYSYYDFIGEIHPQKVNNDISYEFVPGIFCKALNVALKNEDKIVYLVLEEISRGDIASVFGDIFQLLDRDDKGRSIYGINNDEIFNYLSRNSIELNDKKIYIPNNLEIICTANISDQNTYVMDTAFKRRFDMVIMPIKTNDKNNFNFEMGSEIFQWNDFFPRLNDFIVDQMELSEDKQIGPWFIVGNDNIDDNSAKIKNKLLSYLWEDVEKSVYENDQKMFPGIKSFSTLYSRFEEGENVFNDVIFYK